MNNLPTVVLATILSVGFSMQVCAAKPPTKEPIQRSPGCVTNKGEIKPYVNFVSSPSYPPIPSGATEFEIPTGDTCAHLSILRLPAGFTLRVAPGVSTIQWQVDQIQFGPGATFDLSASPVKSAKPPKPQTEGQADYCAKGDRGANGVAGKDGGNAANLIITGVQAITNSSGGLWVRNDGGPGQDSGDSGDGQHGGGHWGRWPNECERHDGGPPGDVLKPGRGGSPSVVSITNYPNLISTSAASKSKSPIKVTKVPAPSGACGPSTRPPGAVANTGAIVVFGQPGCNGIPGTRGQPGG